jgi:hypothetical protein
MTGQWHFYVSDDNMTNIVGFLPDGLGMEDPPPVCEIVVSSVRDGWLLRDILRSFETEPRA